MQTGDKDENMNEIVERESYVYVDLFQALAD